MKWPQNTVMALDSPFTADEMDPGPIGSVNFWPVTTTLDLILGSLPDQLHYLELENNVGHAFTKSELRELAQELHEEAQKREGMRAYGKNPMEEALKAVPLMRLVRDSVEKHSDHPCIKMLRNILRGEQ